MINFIHQLQIRSIKQINIYIYLVFRKYSSLLLVFALSLFSVGAFAENLARIVPQGISAVYSKCISEYVGNTTQAGFCISEETQLQNTRLNQIYKNLLSTLSASQKNKLSAAQRAWLKQQALEERFQIALYGRGDLISNLEIGEDKLFELCRRANQLESALNTAKSYK